MGQRSGTVAPAGKQPVSAVYVCGAGSGKDRTVAVIELEEKVPALCRRHPEMGPCQNARNACRRSGGRANAADGSEVTQTDEAEYDKKVMRVRVGRDSTSSIQFQFVT